MVILGERQLVLLVECIAAVPTSIATLVTGPLLKHCVARERYWLILTE